MGTPLPGTEVRVVTENVDGEKEVREFSSSYLYKPPVIGLQI